MITLCTTVFNDMPIWRVCVQRILGELNENVSWVIVDGRSTDGTLELTNSKAEKRDNMLSFIPQEHLRRGAARNTAAILARDRFKADILIHAIDGDVIYRPGFVDLIANTFIMNGCNPIAGDSFFVISTEDYFKAGGYSHLQTEEDYLFYSMIVCKGLRLLSKRLNVWEFDFQEACPVHNLAEMGSDKDMREPILYNNEKELGDWCRCRKDGDKWLPVESKPLSDIPVVI
jgi:glycosyltransferase involved in cell wall biosynthesis